MPEIFFPPNCFTTVIGIVALLVLPKRLIELGKIVLASVHDWKGRGGEGSKDPDFLASLPSILEIGH